MKEDRIEVGDTVRVILPSQPELYNYEVLSVPGVAGEAWILRSRDYPGKLIYVQQYETMELLLKKPIGTQGI